MVVQMHAFRRRGRAHWAAGIARVARPKPGRGQVLIRCKRCGACGSDLHVLNCAPGSEGFPAEVTFGHEVSGEVAECGEGVEGLPVGTRVALVAIQGCGACEYCSSGYMQLCEKRRVQGLSIDGGMAEYMVVDAQHLIVLPPDISDVEGAMLEPATIGIHCADLLGDLTGKRVFIAGAGIIAQLTALAARDRKAIVTMSGLEKDSNTRLRVARELGFQTIVVGPDKRPTLEQYREVNDGRMADIMIEASGAPQVIVEAYAGGYHSVVKPGGEMMLVAIYETGIPDFRPTGVVRFQRKLSTSYGSDPSDYPKAMDLMRRKVIPVDQLVTEYPLDAAFQAYEDSARSKMLKAVVNCAA